MAGAALTPAFVDAHMHLESTKLWIDEFVRAVLPHGTTAVAADPHEIANVLGVPGIVALVEAAAPLPFTFGVYASSCVPASQFESAGAALDAGDVRELIERHGARGVAEVMNFPGVIAGDPEMLARIAAADGRRVDGHSPGVLGRALDAYLAAGVESDHESTTLEEVVERRRKGMWVFIRQGSASQNLEALIPDVIEHGTDLAAFCTDDREPDTLLRLGHINDCARLAVAAGVPEVDALLLASTNPARYHGFHHLGDLGPGKQADVLCFDELGSWRPARVWQAGRLVVEGGELVAGAVPSAPVPELMLGTVRVGDAAGARAARPLPPGRGARARRRRREPQHHDPRPPADARRPRRRPCARRRGRAPPCERPCGPRLRHGLRDQAGRDGVDGRPRRPQLRDGRRARRRRCGGHGRRRRAPRGDRRRPGRCARGARGGRGAATAGRADERSPRRRGGGADPTS